MVHQGQLLPNWAVSVTLRLPPHAGRVGRPYWVAMPTKAAVVDAFGAPALPPCRRSAVLHNRSEIEQGWTGTKRKGSQFYFGREATIDKNLGGEWCSGLLAAAFYDIARGGVRCSLA